MVMDEKTPKWADFDWITVVFGVKSWITTSKKLATIWYYGELAIFKLAYN